MFNKLRYEILPYIKARLVFGWWVLWYGGAKNIPPELLWRRMEKNLECMRDNLNNALRALPDDATDEERRKLLDAILESKKLESAYHESITKQKR